jgi:hypothetical protein
VVDAAIVEVDGLLDQSEAESFDCEVEVRLRGADGGRDVMQTENGMRHVSRWNE